jgi:hypothetical protein
VFTEDMTQPWAPHADRAPSRQGAPL